MSIISRTSQYALRALTLLATRPDERLTVKELAHTIGAPQPYLSRIILILADNGLLDTSRGPGGGVRLGQEARHITLMEIITIFEGPDFFDECALGLPGCKHADVKCPVHDQWSEIKEEIKQWWRKTTLADFDPETTELCMNERVRDIDFAALHRIRSRWH